MPLPLCPREIDHYPFYRRLGGPQVRSGREWKIFLHSDVVCIYNILLSLINCWYISDCVTVNTWKSHIIFNYTAHWVFWPLIGFSYFLLKKFWSISFYLRKETERAIKWPFCWQKLLCEISQAAPICDFFCFLIPSFKLVVAHGFFCLRQATRVNRWVVMPCHWMSGFRRFGTT
jgi:hypothetical protein